MTDTATLPKPAPGRPQMDPDALERQTLTRIAQLAHEVLQSLRKRNGKYSSERELRSFLADDGATFSNGELRTALALLEGSGKIIRPDTGLSRPRPGRLPEAVPKPAEDPHSTILSKIILECAGASDGRGWPTEAELIERVHDADGVEFTDAELDECLTRLIDCGQLQRTRRGPGHTVKIVHASRYPLDAVDELEADICALLRTKDTEFADDQLREWLDEAEIAYDDNSLRLAVEHLFWLGRLKQPRADHWEDPDTEPPIRFVEPQTLNEVGQGYY